MIDNINSIVELKDYGKIKLHLDKLIAEKGINRNILSKRIDVRFEVISKWCSGTVARLDLDVLAKLCYALDCSVGDIVEYINKEGEHHD